MTTLQTSAPARKTPRTLRVLARPTTEAPGRLAIITPKGTDTYAFRCYPAKDGIEYAIANEADPERRTYTCTITPEAHDCTCKGFQFRGRCKHCDALAALTMRDAATAQMPAPTPKVETPAAPRSLVCYACRDTRIVRRKTAGGECVGRCVTCDGF